MDFFAMGPLKGGDRRRLRGKGFILPKIRAVAKAHVSLAGLQFLREEPWTRSGGEWHIAMVKGDERVKKVNN